ncbi:MAG TPA: hypothetical protein VFD91_08465, partial [Mariniphaga sp.]|nr:hypothetical protein [Mariniphaga sp.]
MAIEPSPTAEATRFTEPFLTSPTAKKPGMLASSDCGFLCSKMEHVVIADSMTSTPVWMNPLLSIDTIPCNHSVQGFAPMKV